MTPSPTAPPVQDETNESEETDKPESGVARPESDSGPPAVPNQDGTEVADAEATGVYGNAYNRDAEFYAFTKAMETYEQTMDPSTIFILGTDNELLRFLEQPQ